MKENDIFGIILAGGSGSRLWPLSRELYPKQLLKLTNKNTLFQQTFLRLAEKILPNNILTVTNVKHSADINLQLRELNIPCENKVIIEPLGRNTAPAIGLGTYYIIKKLEDAKSDPIILVAPSDHIIQNSTAFNEAVMNGKKLAQDGFIVTFGVKPDKPDTGYGYIKTSETSEIQDGLKVDEFKEKPDAKTAEEYVKSKDYYWNGGIFMFKASTMMNELKKYSPNIYETLITSDLSEAGPTMSFENYEKMDNISIDYAVMEKSSLIALIPLDCGWNDVGSWEALYDISKKDEKGNFISGNVVDIDSHNSMIYSTSKLVTTIGLKDIVLVETEDAILACNKNRTQDVKQIFEKLKGSDNDAYREHKTVYRPWGYYTVLQKGDGFLTKCIQVNPSAKLSIQLHNHRSEHWVVLEGKAKVIKGEEEFFLNAGDSIDIPLKVKHSLQNPYESNLKIIEVQRGDYIAEDDIIRFDDLYGRTSK